MTSPIAYSYIRFSGKPQEKGDSIRRQTAGTQAWAEKSGIALDTSLKIDKGLSAYKGINADVGALGEFLRRIQTGEVARGSYLVVESLDRLTRNDVDEALPLLLGMTNAGIRIVQLVPVEVLYQKPVDPMKLIMMVMELMRGNGESKVKSERVGGAWQEKRERRRKGLPQNATARMGNSCMVLTSRLPGWLTLKDGIPVAIPERVAIVKRLFNMVIAGHGLTSIVRALTTEKILPLGRKAHWSRSYIHDILTGGAVLGTFQPKKGGVPDGPPILNYFPAVIDQATYHKAGVAMEVRKNKRGRVGKNINVFSGLVKNARHGDSMIRTTRIDRKGNSVPVLIPASSEDGRTTCVSFPFDTFEKAILACLKEIDPREILPEDKPADEVLSLAGEVASLEASLLPMKIELDREFSPTLMAVIRDKEAKISDRKKQLQRARQEESCPLAESWGEFKSLLETLQNAPNEQEARLRLRAALRRCVDSIWVVATGSGVKRYAEVQVHFKDSPVTRFYSIYHKPPRFNGKTTINGYWLAYSFTSDEIGAKYGPVLDYRALSEETIDAMTLEMPTGIDELVASTVGARAAMEKLRGHVPDGDVDGVLAKLDAETAWGIVPPK